MERSPLGIPVPVTKQRTLHHSNSNSKKRQNYSTQYSQVVTYPSTDCASTSLTSEIGRDPVLSGVYGRS